MPAKHERTALLLMKLVLTMDMVPLRMYIAPPCENRIAIAGQISFTKDIRCRGTHAPGHAAPRAKVPYERSMG